MLLYVDTQDSLLEVTHEGNVKFPSTAWGKSYSLEAIHVAFFVAVLADIRSRCPMALVDLHFLCEKGRMAIEIPLFELEAIVAYVPLIALSGANELVLNVKHPLVRRFLLDLIIIEGFTARLDPVIVDVAKSLKWRREDFPRLDHFLRLTA
ncbi:MAG: hypothetical protein NVSMB39_2870 [Candidatus Saccharimonadales bacterium]